MLSHCLLRKIKYLFSSPDQGQHPTPLILVKPPLSSRQDRISLIPWQDGVCILEWHLITTKLLYLIKIRIAETGESCNTIRDTQVGTTYGGRVFLAEQ